MKVSFLCAAAVVSSVAVGAAQQQSPQPQPEPQPRATQATAGIPENSSGFVAKAIESGAREVAISELAVKKAVNPAVKAFATRMVADHGKANAELARLAADQSIQVSNTGAAVTTATNKLSPLTGAEFDRAYMEMQVRSHQDSVTLFEHESTKGSDATIKAFATKTLATIREHQRMAHEAAEAVGVKGH
jgi:putative membrane protein